MRKYETLELRACDFKETKFFGIGKCDENPCNGCAIQKAMYREYGFPYVGEAINECHVGLDEANSIIIRHERYYMDTFSDDKSLAASHNYDNTIIRKIKLYYES